MHDHEPWHIVVYTCIMTQQYMRAGCVTTFQASASLQLADQCCVTFLHLDHRSVSSLHTHRSLQCRFLIMITLLLAASMTPA